MRNISEWDYSENDEKKATITYENMSGDVGIKQDYSVKIPNIYTKENFISIKEHELKKILDIALKGSKKKKDIGSILINLGWAALGSYISFAITIGKFFDSTTNSNIFGTTIMLIVTIVSFIVGYFLHKVDKNEEIQACEQISEILKPLVEEESNEY